MFNNPVNNTANICFFPIHCHQKETKKGDKNVHIFNFTIYFHNFVNADLFQHID